MLAPLLTAADFSTATRGAIPANDPRLDLLLAGASSAIRRYCGWHVAPVVDDVLTLDRPGGDLLILPTLRVERLDAVTVLGEPLDIDAVEWSANGEVRGRWPERFRSIVVSLAHGFDPDAASDIRQVVQQVVGNAIASPLGATREQAGQVAVQWSTTAPGVSGGLSLLERDLAVLNTYRLPGGA